METLSFQKIFDLQNNTLNTLLFFCLILICFIDLSNKYAYLFCFSINGVFFRFIKTNIC